MIEIVYTETRQYIVCNVKGWVDEVYDESVVGDLLPIRFAQMEYNTVIIQHAPASKLRVKYAKEPA